jgi:nitrilase
LLQAGAEIITIPSAFTVKTGQAHWEVLVRARAIENSCYVIAAGQGGMHANGRRTYGHSMIVDPWGTVLASLPSDDPGVICASVDLALIKKIRDTLPMQLHQRL